jgi:predicted porin
MISSGAMAADKIKMGVGGYFQVAIAAGDQDDDDDKRMHLITEEGEIIFNGKTTLDNGLQVGVQVQLEAETCGDQIDEHFMWMSGGFGRIQLGAENSAPYLMGYASPAPSHWAHGLNSPNFSHAGLVVETNLVMTSDSEKITYFTPRMAGFQLGVSYTPENDEAGSGDGYNSSYSGFPSDSEPGEQGEIIEVGVNYVNKFDDVSLAISAGYAAGSLESASATVDDDQTVWNAGFQIGFAGFTIGGAYR